MSQIEGHQVGEFLFTQSACSGQVFNLLDEAHLHYAGQSNLLRPQI